MQLGSHTVPHTGTGVWPAGPVAVRFIVSPTLTPDTSPLKEALLSQRLSHPHVVQTYAVRTAHLDAGFIQRALEGCEQDSSRSRHPWGDEALSRSSMSSDWGFGDTYKDDSGVSCGGRQRVHSWWPQIQADCACSAGSYLTIVISELCSQGALLQVIAKGLFRSTTFSNSREMAVICLSALICTARDVAQGMSHLHANRVRARAVQYSAVWCSMVQYGVV